MQSIRLLIVAFSLGVVLSFAVCSVSKVNAKECTSSFSLIDGQRAQCSGILWPKSWALEALACVEVDLPQSKQQTKACELVSQSCENSLLDLQANHKIAVDQLEEIARGAAGLNVKPWYEHPVFLVGVGIMGGAGLVYFFDER